MCPAFLEEVLELISCRLSVSLSSFEQSSLEKHSPGPVDTNLLCFNFLHHLPDFREVGHSLLHFDGFNEKILIEWVEFEAFQKDL